ncbi:hypothetical protein BGZ54_010567 [Gamsiella multidivaricata]|nr:hypothetical protein BGZ54_010567 [Gamsiella multidivaricata]
MVLQAQRAKLFELCIIKSACSIIAIIVSVVKKIKIFFIIFAGTILALARAFLHLLWVNTSEDDKGDEERVRVSDYPQGFAQAPLATYYFVSGRNNPVDDKFESKDEVFPVMKATFIRAIRAFSIKLSVRKK